MYEQLVNYEQQDTKDQNATAASEMLRAKVGYSAWSLHTVCLRGYTSCPAHQSTPTLSPHLRDQVTSPLGKSKGTCSPSCCSIAARVIVKLCLNSFAWPFIHFY